jgi:peptidoglycan hydrolase CwlO-like protein
MIKEISFNKPKTRKAALNQAVYMEKCLDNCFERKENIMNNRKAVSEKIAKLNLVLQEFEKQIVEIDKSATNWHQALENLKLEHSLTEAEILELKSSLLRTKIEELQYQADATEQRTRLL